MDFDPSAVDKITPTPKFARATIYKVNANAPGAASAAGETTKTHFEHTHFSKPNKPSGRHATAKPIKEADEDEDKDEDDEEEQSSDGDDTDTGGQNRDQEREVFDGGDNNSIADLLDEDEEESRDEEAARKERERVKDPHEIFGKYDDNPHRNRYEKLLEQTEGVKKAFLLRMRELLTWEKEKCTQEVNNAAGQQINMDRKLANLREISADLDIQLKKYDLKSMHVLEMTEERFRPRMEEMGTCLLVTKSPYCCIAVYTV